MSAVPPGAVAAVDTGAFRANLRRLAAIVAPVPVMAMVKADAYGHGMVPIARAAVEAGAGWLGALELTAALTLREAHIEVPLFAWLHGSDTDWAAAAEARVDLGIGVPWQLEAIARTRLPRPLRVHLKIDTGLHRNGVTPEGWPDFVRRALELEASGRIEIVAVWSHLADAGPEADAAALAELNSAVEVARALGAEVPLVHLAASSAGIYCPEARLGLVRFGIAAYGISPFDDRTGAELGMAPVMTLRAPVTETFADGTAAVAAGFGDGVPEPAAGRGELLLGGIRVPLLRIEAERSIVRGPVARPGEEAVLFGATPEGARDAAPTAEEWAVWADTIGDEIVTGVSARVPRLYSDSPQLPLGTRAKGGHGPQRLQ